jgi:hypothetical protein
MLDLESFVVRVAAASFVPPPTFTYIHPRQADSSGCRVTVQQYLILTQLARSACGVRNIMTSKLEHTYMSGHGQTYPEPTYPHSSTPFSALSHTGTPPFGAVRTAQ